MMVGDKVIYNSVEYTVYLIEDNTAHLIDENNNGISILNTDN